ncbi:MAG: stage III sporulation protein AE [Clostridia bacterium]
MKKIFLVIMIILSSLLVLSFFKTTVTAYADETSDIESEIEDTIDGQLGGLDISEIEKILASIGEQEYEIFGNKNFSEFLMNILSGEFSENGKNFFSAILALVFDDILIFLPLVATIVSISILCGFVSNIRSRLGSKATGDIVHFVCYGVVILLVMNVVRQMIGMTTSTLNLLKEEMDAIFPILLTLMTTIGGSVSVSVYQPMVAVLSGGIVQIGTSVLMPIFIFILIFSVLSNLSSSFKFEKFVSFFSSCFKWILGTSFTIFIAFLSIQGITASSLDGVSIRTAKFAIRSYIPIVGGYLSDGFNVIMASSVLIKNAVGAAGLMLLFATIAVPIIKILIFSLSMHLASAILEPLADSRTANFVHTVAKTCTLLVAILICVSFMFLLTTGLIMCTANVF